VSDFEQAVSAAIDGIGAQGLHELATAIRTSPRHIVTTASARSGFADIARAVLAAKDQAGCTDVEAVAYMQGVAAGYTQRTDEVRVDSVWSGPNTHRVPVRATAQVLIDVVGEATRELALTTYSAKPYQPLLDALTTAIGRGVAVTIVVETLQGAGSALTGAEPAAAFASVRGIQLWHWPTSERTAQGGKMHAKVAVADSRILLVSSANLTQSGIQTNIEAGILVRGGAAPIRAAEHIAELKVSGALKRLHAS